MNKHTHKAILAALWRLQDALRLDHPCIMHRQIMRAIRQIGRVLAADFDASMNRMRRYASDIADVLRDLGHDDAASNLMDACG